MQASVDGVERSTVDKLTGGEIFVHGTGRTLLRSHILVSVVIPGPSVETACHNIFVLNLVLLYPDVVAHNAVAAVGILAGDIHRVAEGRSHVEMTFEAVASTTVVDGVVGQLAGVVYRQVQRHDAVAAIDVGVRHHEDGGVGAGGIGRVVPH